VCELPFADAVADAAELLLQVPAVILSAAKDPEGLDCPPTSMPFNQESQPSSRFSTPSEATYDLQAGHGTLAQKPCRKTRPFCRGLERSPMAERPIAFIFFVFPLLHLFFCVFCPKIACQVPKRPNSLHISNIRIEY
jgi:hypothetical protein